jgi:drug/metabolite transporter superfamily protein YnfA
VHAPAVLHLEETHPVDAVLAVVTMALGAVGLLLVLGDADRAATVTGGVGVLTGLWGQMVSRTRPERFLDVIGLVCAVVAFALGLAFGDFTFNG